MKSEIMASWADGQTFRLVGFQAWRRQGPRRAREENRRQHRLILSLIRA